MTTVVVLVHLLKATKGSWKILIIAAGKNKERGKTLSLVAGESDETP